MNNPDQIVLDPAIAMAKFNRETDLFQKKPELWRNQGWEFVEVKFPFLKIIFKDEIAIIVNCRNYNLQPPSVVFADPKNFTLLNFQQIKNLCKGQGRYILDNHPVTHLPFICMQGFWEYHSHDGHLNDSWDNYKRSMTIPYCIDRAYSVIYE